MYIVCLHSHLLQATATTTATIIITGFMDFTAAWGILSLCSVHCCFFFSLFFMARTKTTMMMENEWVLRCFPPCCTHRCYESVLLLHYFHQSIYLSCCLVLYHPFAGCSALSFNSFRGPRDHKREYKVRLTLEERNEMEIYLYSIPITFFFIL